MPDAEIIAVGSELLTPQRLDTNSLYLTDQLNALGVEVVRKTVVGDERERLTDTILGAVARSQIMVLTGGLGPTEDDLTREAVACALGRSLVFHQEICDRIEARIRRFGRKMAEINRAPGVCHRRRRGTAQRSRHRARPVDLERRRGADAASRTAERIEGDVRGAMPATPGEAPPAAVDSYALARVPLAWRSRTWIN